MVADRRGGEDRRKQERNRKRLSVRYGPGDLAHSGTAQNVSERGVFLQGQVVYPPKTILVLMIDYPEGPASLRGIVRWSKLGPPTVQRGVRNGMGVEFLESAETTPRPEPAADRRTRAAPAAAPAAAVRVGTPPDRSEDELAAVPTRRRQVSTLSGGTFEVLETECRGAFYIRVFQLPRSEGSAEALFRQAFWNRETAESALKGFLKRR